MATRGLAAVFAPRAGRAGNYPYAVARVRVKKSKLLPRETYQKLLVMDIPEITQVIGESQYRREVDELSARFKGLDLVEGALNLNEERTYAEIRGFVEGEARVLANAFLDRFRYQDVKIILRGKHYGASPEEMMRELLIEDREQFGFFKRLLAPEVEGIEGVITALEEIGLPARPYARALKHGRDIADSPGTQDYEDALDMEYYADLLATIAPDAPAKKLFLRFVRREIDAKNFLAALRYRRAKESWEELEKVFLPGGQEVDAAMARRLLEAPGWDEVEAEAKGLSFHQGLSAALAETRQGASLSGLGIAAEKELMRFAESFGRRNPLSILPILDFILRKHVEVRNLRAVVRGKQASLSSEEIRAMLILV